MKQGCAIAIATTVAVAHVGFGALRFLGVRDAERGGRSLISKNKKKRLNFGYTQETEVMVELKPEPKAKSQKPKPVSLSQSQ
mgnify:CR=1 FL=1